MKKDTTYKQCVMEKPTKNGFKCHVAWIPNKFAVLGKYLKIDELGDGWKVVFDGGKKEITSKAADNMSQMYKKTRKASDI